MTRVPIRVRMAAAFAVAMALVLAATGWFLYMRVDSHLAATLDRQLLVRTHDLKVIVREPGSSLAAASGAPSVEAGENYAQLLDGRGNVVDATPPLGTVSLLSPADLRRARAEAFFANRRSVPGLDEQSRMLVSPVVRVAAASSSSSASLGRTAPRRLGPSQRASHRRSDRSGVGIHRGVLPGGTVAPCGRVDAPASGRNLGRNAGERLPVPRTGDELERLGETLNAMLARLENALEREREFVADAGHELRTPLALLRTELELALRHAEGPEELRDAVRVSSEEVDRLAQLAEDLLLIAGSDRGKLPLRLETLETAELLDSIANRFEWRAQEAGRRVVW
jgi:signal transduction histidine kinase